MPKVSTKTKKVAPKKAKTEIEEVDPIKDTKIIEAIDPIDAEPALVEEVPEEVEVLEEETEDDDEAEVLGGSWDE